MDVFEFIIAISWVLIAMGALSLVTYLIVSGRIQWLQKIPANEEKKVTETLEVKELNADEILAFESFICSDLPSMERGIRLAYVQRFVEQDLLIAQFEGNVLQIELTEKGKQIHSTIIEDCEKKLMITPSAEIKWRSPQKKTVRTMEEKLVGRMNIR